MDTFNEQLVKIKPTAKTWLLWILSVLGTLVAILVCLFVMQYIGALAILLIAGVIYLMYYIISRQFTEYEYIFTNGELDIDKITAKSSRKRLLTIDCKSIEVIEKYTKDTAEKGDRIYCNYEKDNMFRIKGYRKNGAAASIVISPNEKIKSALKFYIPIQMRKDVFGE